MYGQDTGSQEDVHKMTSCTAVADGLAMLRLAVTMGVEAGWGSSQAGQRTWEEKYYIGMQPQEGIRTN
jgi:hypothetical protein